MESSEFYGLDTGARRPHSILEQIRTCTNPKQLDYMIQWVGKIINYKPSARWYRKFKTAVRAAEIRLNHRVMYTAEEVTHDKTT